MATSGTATHPVIELCSHCGGRVLPSDKFCAACGTQTVLSSPQGQAPPTSISVPHAATARGFAQAFGLHPAVALLTVAVDLMVFGSGDLTLGVGWLASVPVGAVVGIIAYLAQKKWYGDDKESALIKALIVGFLTAIPTSLPGLISAPMGILGLFRGKKS